MNTVVALLASFGAFAVAAQPPSEANPPAPPTEVQSHMAEMQALMERIRTTKDPEERERLMAEHLRLMQESMTMMGGPMMRGPGGAEGQRPCANDDLQCRMQRMQSQQGMMGQRMGMMQMMMQQMMEHMTQQEAADAPNAGQ